MTGRQSPPNPDPETCDVAVVGGGAAGLESALVLGRQGRSVIVFDSADYRNARSTGAHMLIGMEGTPPADIRARAHDELAALDTVRYRRTAVTDGRADAERDGVELACDDGTAVFARRVIVGSGLRDVIDGLPGLSESHGRYSFHCPYCHGHEARGKDIVVVSVPGTPPMKAAYQALYLRDRISDRVRLLAERSSIPEELLAALPETGVELIDGAATGISGEPGAVEVTSTSTGPLQCEVVFAVPPTAAGGDLGERLGAEMNGGCIVVDDHGRSSVPQVFAAGDCAVRRSEPEPLTFVAQAIGEGQQVAVWADQDLFMSDPRIPVPTAQ